MTQRELARKYGISRTALRYRQQNGLPLDTPPCTPQERGRRGFQAVAAKGLWVPVTKQERRERREADPMSEIVPGQPHEFHRMLARAFRCGGR